MARGSLPLPDFVLLEDAGVAQSMDIVIGTTFSSIVSVCCSMPRMRYGLSVLGSNLLYVGLSIVLEMLVVTASSDLSRNTSLLVSKTDASRTRFFWLYSVVSGLSTFLLVRASLVRRRIRNILGDILTDKFDVIAEIKLNVVAPGGFLDSRKRNGDARLCIDDIVYFTQASMAGRINRIYPGARQRNAVSARLSSCRTFRLAQSSGDDTRIW